MRTIRISDEVWQEIAKRGKFGETEDDVLRMVFQIKANGPDQGQSMRRPQGHFSKDKMHAKVYQEADGSCLKISFRTSGMKAEFELPGDKSDKRAIRIVLESALEFGEANGASKGQLFAIRKALTEAGYHLTK